MVMEYDLVGQRFTTIVPREVMRDSIAAGVTGTVIEAEWDEVWLKLDDHHEILDEWDNCIVWSLDDDENYAGVEDGEPSGAWDARHAFMREVEEAS